LPPEVSGVEIIQRFRLEINRSLHATWLSLVYGLASGRLWRCKGCRQPFIRTLGRLRALFCATCGHARTVTTAAGLPYELALRYRRRRVQLAVWRNRGHMSPSTCQDLQQAALREVRQVEAGTCSLQAWDARHATSIRGDRLTVTARG
jgi:ketopantoate reductase